MLTRRRLLPAGAGLLLAAGVMLLGSGLAGAAPKQYAVSMTTASGKKVFKPTTITINIGDGVTWTNDDAPTVHNLSQSTHGDDWSPALASGNVLPTASRSYTFKSPGTYAYFCNIHGTDGATPSGMRGTVIVVDPSPTTPPTPTSATPSPTRTTASPTAPPPTSPPAPTPPPSATSASTPPIGGPDTSSPVPTPANPLPTVRPTLPGEEPQPSSTPKPSASAALVSLGGSGPPSHRGRNTVLVMAGVLLGGLLWAEVRTLLATPTDADPQPGS